MRARLFMLVLFSLLLTLTTCSEFDEHPCQIDFIESSLKEGAFNKVSFNSDGSFFKIEKDWNDTKVIKMDSSNEFWSIDFSQIRIKKVIEAVDEGYILAGDSIATPKRIIWIGHFSNNGELLWKITYDEATFQDIISTTDGNYLTIGRKGKVLFFKTSSEGEITHEVSYGGSKLNFGFSVTELDNGKFLGFGATNSKDGDLVGNWTNITQKDDVRNWVIVLDQDLDSFGDRLIDTGLYPNLEPMEILHGPDGGLYLIGHSISGSSLIKIDSEGKLIWQREGNIFRYEDIETVNGKLYSFGRDPQSEHGAMLSQHDLADGKILSCRNYSWDRVEIFVWAQHRNGKFLVMVGSSQVHSSGPNKYWTGIIDVD